MKSIELHQHTKKFFGEFYSTSDNNAFAISTYRRECYFTTIYVNVDSFKSFIDQRASKLLAHSLKISISILQIMNPPLTSNVIVSIEDFNEFYRLIAQAVKKKQYANITVKDLEFTYRWNEDGVMFGKISLQDSLFYNIHLDRREITTFLRYSRKLLNIHLMKDNHAE